MILLEYYLQFHPCGSKMHAFVLPYFQVIFHSICTAWFLYPGIYSWTLGLFPYFGYGEQAAMNTVAFSE